VFKKTEVPLIKGGKALNSHSSNKLLGFQVSSHWHINSNIYSSKSGLYSLVLFTVAQGGRYSCFLLPVLVFAVYVTLNNSG
jgi:hypothetical protein